MSKTQVTLKDSAEDVGNSLESFAELKSLLDLQRYTHYSTFKKHINKISRMCAVVSLYQSFLAEVEQTITDPVLRMSLLKNINTLCMNMPVLFEDINRYAQVTSKFFEYYEVMKLLKKKYANLVRYSAQNARETRSGLQQIKMQQQALEVEFKKYKPYFQEVTIQIDNIVEFNIKYLTPIETHSMLFHEVLQCPYITNALKTFKEFGEK